MSRRFVAVMAALICLASVFPVGCQTGFPRENYARVQDAYIATVAVLIDARSAGAVDEATWQETVLPLINQGDAALDAYSAATKAGLSTDDPLREIQRVLEALRPFLVEDLKEESR